MPPLDTHPQPVQIRSPHTDKIPVVPVLHAGRLPFAAYKHFKAIPTMQSSVVVVKVKANVVTVCRFIKNQSSCFCVILKSSCFLIAAVHIVVDKGGVIAVNGVGRVEKYRFQILLDVTDFRGVLFHAVKDKFNVAAVQLHKLCFDKLCRIIVPGDTDCLRLCRQFQG